MPRLNPRALRISLTFLAILLLTLGLYSLRVFELCAKFIALLSLFSSSGHALPRSVEIAFLTSQSLALAACFAPAIYLAAARRIKWHWIGAICLLVFGGLQTSQYLAYLHLGAALPKSLGSANQCPRFSASGLVYAWSSAMAIAPELLVEVDNEQCMMLKLAHDTELGMDIDWEVFKLKAYDPRFISHHYAQNAVFPLTVVLAKSLKRMDLIDKDRILALKLVDRAGISLEMTEALAYVIKNQDQTIQKVALGNNPLNALVARLVGWEEASILRLTRP